jgi:hypothetical protein
MHCPQCGQQQVSDEVRFCKGCGFALSAVKELLVTGGISPTEIESNKLRVSPRRRGVRQGAILLFIAMCLLPLASVIGDRWGEIIPLTFVMAGLMRLLYAGIFQEGAPKTAAQVGRLPPAATNRVGQVSTASERVLPPVQGVPVTDFQAARGVTKEMAGPPSVTEQTTKLLDDQDRPTK